MGARHQVLCASGVLGPPGLSGVDEVLAYGPTLPTEGIEFLVRNSHRGKLDELLPRLRASGLRFPVVHLDKGVGARLPQAEACTELAANLDFAAALGAELGVLHLWDLPDSDRHFRRRIEAYQIAAEIAEAHGVRLGIETTPCAINTPLNNLRQLLDACPEVSVVFDTEYLAAHDELEAALDDEAMWRALRHIHIKDYDGGPFDESGRRRYLGPGEGSIDFGAVSSAMRRWGYCGTVSLEAGPEQTVEGPSRQRLDTVLRVMAGDGWKF